MRGNTDSSKAFIDCWCMHTYCSYKRTLYKSESLSMHFVSVPSHLTECRRTKGDKWEKCTKCTRIQRIQTEFPSSHAISNYCQILSTNDKRRMNIHAKDIDFRFTSLSKLQPKASEGLI